MSVYTFSTKGTKPTDTQIVDEVKQHCDDDGLNFSALVVKLVIKWHKENLRDGRA